MDTHEIQKLGVVAIGLGASVAPTGGIGSATNATIRITPRRGDVLETESYDEAMDHLCGNTIDRVSFRPAQIVGAEDTRGGSVICRRCLLDEPGRMSDRFRHLAPGELKKMLDHLGNEKCSRCGRSVNR